MLISEKKTFSQLADRLLIKLTIDLQRKPKATKKELITLICCKLNDNFVPAYETKLYNKHSTEYCRSLELLNWYFEK